MKNANIELHLHPFLGKNILLDVEDAMDSTDIDVVAMEAFDDSIFPKVVEEAHYWHDNIDVDNAGLRLPNGKYMLNAREYNTLEKLHLLTVGYALDAEPDTEIRKIIDSGLEHDALVGLDHPFAANDYTRTAGHISEKLTVVVEDLCREYDGEIFLEWNAYCNPIMRRVLKIALNLVGHPTKYHDVNQKVEDLSEIMKIEGRNIPVLPDTDLHARRPDHLRHMGRSRFITDLEGYTAEEIVKSMKEQVFSGNYEPIKKPVSIPHLFDAFCLPVMFPKYFDKPRA